MMMRPSYQQVYFLCLFNEQLYLKSQTESGTKLKKTTSMRRTRPPPQKLKQRKRGKNYYIDRRPVCYLIIFIWFYYLWSFVANNSDSFWMDHSENNWPLIVTSRSLKMFVINRAEYNFLQLNSIRLKSIRFNSIRLRRFIVRFS